MRLSRKEYDLMELLLRNGGRIVTKETLLVKVWGYETDAEDNNVEEYISFLRKKLTHLRSRVRIKDRPHGGVLPGGPRRLKSPVRDIFPHFPQVFRQGGTLVMIRKLRVKFVVIMHGTGDGHSGGRPAVGVFRRAAERPDPQPGGCSTRCPRRMASCPIRNVRITIDGSLVLLPYFTVNVYPNSSGYLADVTGGTYSNLDDSEILTAILRACLAAPEAEGFLEDYHLRYLRQDRGFYIRLAFVDTSMERAILREMMSSYLIIALGSLLLLLGVSLLLSRWATQPWSGPGASSASSSPTPPTS